jgi:hypothetical protein
MWLRRQNALPGKGADAASARRAHFLSQKLHERWKWLLTGWEGGDYIRLNNEGGAPLAAPEFASTEAYFEMSLLTKSREPRKRHSTGSEGESGQAPTLRHVMSVL